MTTTITSFLDLYVLTPGRRLWALSQVRPLAQARGLEAIVAAIDAASAHDREVLELDARRRRGPSPALPSVRELDAEVDRTLTMIDRLLLHYVRREGEAGIGASLHADLFPAGLRHHIRLPHVEQLSANARAIALLDADRYATWLASHGFGPLIDELRAGQAAFWAALEARDAAKPPSYAQVQAHGAIGQELYCKVVVMILASSFDDPEARAQLLGPITAAEREVADQRRRRRKVSEVDPDSGEPLDARDDAGDEDGDEGRGEPAPSEVDAPGDDRLGPLAPPAPPAQTSGASLARVGTSRPSPGSGRLS